MTKIMKKLCECGCGQPTNFATFTSLEKGWIKGEPLKFCHGHGRRNNSLQIGFWKNVEAGDLVSCWIWSGYINDSGYGQFRCKGVLYRAHRVSYELHKGEIPEGLNVCHRCDNRPCVNPQHLFAGTDLDNVQDMDKKGRRVNSPQRGAKHGMAKLSENNVAEIKLMVASGAENYAAIGKKFGVCDETIGRIIRQKAWKHL